MKVTMPYIGKDLSINYYKVVGRGGKPTTGTKPNVKVWMMRLAGKVKNSDESLSGDITIALWGKFKDSRIPDMANLHKVVGDAVSKGLGINDKFFKFVDLGFTTGCLKPEIDIYISGAVRSGNDKES